MLTDESTVSTALADLAATAGDRPIPLGPIEVRARRMRHRRRAGRAGVVVICAAALATGMGLAGAGRGNQSQLTAAGPSVVLPLCATIDAHAATDPRAAKEAAAAAHATPAVGEMFKALGTVTGRPAADRVTILVTAPLSSTSQPITFAINRGTLFFNGNQPSAATTLRAGQKVGFVATKTGPGGYRLDQIETNLDLAATAAPRKPNAGAVTAAPPAIGQTVEGKGTVAAAPVPGAVTLIVGGGPLAGKTLSFMVTPATRFTSSGRPCDPSGVPAGTPMGFRATRTGTNTYRLDQLDMA